MRRAAFGVAQRCALGETECGDGWLIEKLDGSVTIAVVDGLGHGKEAAVAAKAFCEHVRDKIGDGLETIMTSAQRPMSGTRGAAAALLRLTRHESLLEFVGVGNIAVQSGRSATFHPVSAPGIVGQRVRKLLPFAHELESDLLLVLHSDGISTRFELDGYAHMDPQEMAQAILDDHGKGYDDATCVVVRI
jgi:hypothetical protein